ncbi:hypothetical protein AB0E59_36785 [Lentzea sp. NPDC034063]|uniref:hypothetical protein n=1 Tax=unclassified Lentzea TaxID=2643253 RepID=UPI0033D6F01A
MGAVAGIAGYLTWWWVLPPQCVDAVGRTCDRWSLSGLLVLPVCWAAVASPAHYWTLTLLRLPRAWRATWLGCMFWPVVWIVGLHVGWTRDEVSMIFVPVVAFAVAGAATGRRAQT